MGKWLHVWRRPRVDPPAVQAEIAVAEAELAEPAADRTFVEFGGAVERDPGRGAVEIRVAEVPEVRGVDRQIGFDLGDSGGKFAYGAEGAVVWPSRADASVKSTHPFLACEAALWTVARSRNLPLVCWSVASANRSSSRTAGVQSSSTFSVIPP
jgi:hypothetical protein